MPFLLDKKEAFMTGIYQTQSEYLTRVVMEAVQDLGHDVRFNYHDGWYEVWVVSKLGYTQGKALNLAAKAIERTLVWAFVPRGLADFKELA